MIGAHEAACCAALIGHDRCTAMGADIKKGMNHTVLATGDQHGHAHSLNRLVTSWFAQLVRIGQHQRQALEDGLHLIIPTGFVEIVRHGYRIGVLGRIRCVIGLVFQQSFGQADIF